MAIMTEIVGILYGGISTMASALGAGLSSLAESIFLSGTGETKSLSVFGTLIVVFAGISLSIGLGRWVLNFVTSLGARNR
ncbi:MAG: hypothetical protein J6D30_04775 [Clostridia bacterium]|nr:hypothetical protein [Clostridia bacterium]